MSNKITIPIEIDTLIYENENTTPSALFTSLNRREGPFIILRKPVAKSKEEGKPQSYAPQGTTIKMYNETDEHFIWSANKVLQGIQINQQKKPYPEQEKKGNYQPANYFPHLLEAIKLIVDRNYETRNKELIKNPEVFADLEKLTNYLVKVDISESGKTGGFSIEGPVTEVENHTAADWHRAQPKKYGKGNASFYVDMKVNLDKNFGIENLKVYDIDLFTKFYLRGNYVHYAEKLLPIIQGLAHSARQQRITYDFFGSHDAGKIIRNEEPITLRTFDSEGDITTRIKDFTNKVSTIYSGLYKAIEDMQESTKAQDAAIGRKYFGLK